MDFIKNILFKLFGELFIRKLQMNGTLFINNLKKIDKKNNIIAILNSNETGILNEIFIRNLPSSDWWVYNQIFILKEYQPILNLLKKNNFSFNNNFNIIDAGANIGLTSFFLKSILPNSKIVAIEPEKSNIDIFQKNLTFHKCQNIEIVEGGLWHKTTKLSILPAKKEWSFQVVEQLDGEINAYSVENIRNMYFKNEIIDFLKMDIEGSEMNIFRSNQLNFLNFTNIIAIEVHTKYISFLEISTILENFKFKTFTSGELLIGYK